MSDLIGIRHLRYFLAVAQTENFTRAAERLGISQPSVSQQITQLERALRTPLFGRVGKRVYLTEAGDTFRIKAEVVLRKLEDACNSVSDIAGLVSGHVDIGVIPALHVGWIPAVLESISRDYPGLTISVQELASSAVESELEAGRLDIGFGLITRNSPNLRYQCLISEPFSLIVSAASEFAKRKTVELTELENMRLVLLPESFDMRRAADEVLRHSKVHPKVVFEIDNIDAVLASVTRTKMPTLLPAIVLLGRELSTLRAIPLASKTRKMDFGLLWPSASSTSPTTLAVAAALKAALKSAESGGGQAARRDTRK